MKQIVAILVAVWISCSPSPFAAFAQAVQSVSSGGTRPFVTSFTPVIGSGGVVGGIEVDSRGLIKTAQRGRDPKLAALRQAAIEGVSGELRQFNAQRKISLKGLNAQIDRQLRSTGKLDTEVLYLAGMQAVESVLVYPDHQDIVLVGPAEGWNDQDDAEVGLTTGRAVLRLDDFLDAMHSAFAIADGTPISCSIDPRPEGTRELAQWMRTTKLAPSPTYRQQVEQRMGGQRVTLTSIRRDSHFARVLVGADYRMKRIAMDLEASPVRGMPSYLQMLARGAGKTQLASPRFWLSATCKNIRRDEAGLAWQFDGVSVQAMTRQSLFDDRGTVTQTGQTDPVAQRWCDQFTAQYDAVSRRVPVFDQLRGCINLSLVSALILKEDLTAKANCPLAWLTDPEQLTGLSLTVPTEVASQARLVPLRRGWLVSVSGGVELDPWNLLKENEQVDRGLAPKARQTSPATDRWWWD